MTVSQVGSARARRLRVRWYELAPEVVLAAGLGLFAVTEPTAAASAFKSGKALVLMAVVAVAWVVLRIASLLLVRWSAVSIAVFGIAALAILKIVVLPAYQGHTVIETLPTRSAVPVSTAGGSPPTSAALGATRPTTERAQPVNTTSVAPATTTPAQPVKVKAGSFQGIGHRAGGSVNLYRQPDGHLVVGLEDFDIQPGPAYVLYVVPGNDRRDHDGGTKLDRLRGNKGTQYYDVPAGLDVSAGPWTVLVWCETFFVPVANATPSAL